MLNYTVFGAIGNGNVPTSISKLLSLLIPIIIYVGDAILKLPKVNSTKYGIKSWRYQAARLRNTIPNNLRNIDGYRSFKHGLKELNLVWGQDSTEINIIKQNQCKKYIKSYLQQ